MNETRTSRKRAQQPGASRGRRLVELARGAGWLVVIAAGLRVVDLVLGKSALAASLFGAVFVDIATSRAGVKWDERVAPHAGERRRALAMQLGVGLASVAVVVTITLVASLLAGEARVALGKPSLNLGLAVVRASALGVRDELLLRGIPLLTARRARIPAPFAVAFSALTGVAAIALVEKVSPAALVLAGASGLLFTALWVRFDSAWPTVAGHAAWLLLTGSVLRGDVLDVTWSHGVLTAGSRASGPAAWIASVAFAIGAALVLGRRRPADGGRGSARPLDRPASGGFSRR